MASQPFLKGPFGAPLKHEVNGRWELVPVPEGYVSPPASAIGADNIPPAGPDVIVLDSSDSEAEEVSTRDPEVVILSSSDSEDEDPVPVIAVDDNNNANNVADASDDDSDADDERARDVIHVEPFLPVLRHPACRRRANQLVPCTVGEHGCRMAVAILALDAGELLLRSDNRQVSLPVGVGLHILCWCSANLFFMGMPLSRPYARPLAGWGEFTIEHATPDEVSWMAVTAIYNRMPGPGSYVFPMLREPPSLLATFQTGLGEVHHLPVRPAVDLRPFLPGASYYYVSLSAAAAAPAIEIITLD